MSITIRTIDGFITLAESKAVCIHCNEHIPFDDIEEKYDTSQDVNDIVQVKCSCGKVNEVAFDYRGDYVNAENDNVDSKFFE